MFVGLALAMLTFSATDAEAETVRASWYGEELRGGITASGEPFNPDAMTVAHRTLPIGTKVLISKNGVSVVATVNDRGPYANGANVDLSAGVAREVGLILEGVGPVDLVVI